MRSLVAFVAIASLMGVALANAPTILTKKFGPT